MRTLERISLIEAASRLGVSLPETAALVEAGALRGAGGWVFVESLRAYLAAR